MILQRHVPQQDWETKAALLLEIYSRASESWNRTEFEMWRLVISHHTCKSICQYKPEFGPNIQSGHILYQFISRQKKKKVKFFLGQMGDLACWGAVFLTKYLELWTLPYWVLRLMSHFSRANLHAVPQGRWNTSTRSAEVLHLWMKSVSGNEEVCYCMESSMHCGIKWRFLLPRRVFNKLFSRAHQQKAYYKKNYFWYSCHLLCFWMCRNLGLWEKEWLEL